MQNEDTQIVKTFNNQQIRIIEKNGEPWFVAADVCQILGLKNPRKAVSALAQDEKMTVTKSYGHGMQHGGAQFLNIISESGLYRLLVRSNKPSAEVFVRWVTHEVLPQIRKTGSYNPKANDTIAKLANRITQLVMEKMELTAENRYLKQYHPDGVLGERSEESGLPRNFYRKASYVSRYGRHPKPKESYRQLDLFMDLPALQEARDALNMARDTRPQLFQ